MTLKVLVSATLLGLAPSLALATGCPFGHEKQTQSCASGSVWDAASQSCKPVVSG